jgi:glucoamylase
MTQFRGTQSAFGQPGIEPRWTHSNKDGVGTAYASSSRVWFTLWNGILTEAYFPTLDKPQMRDLQYLVSDGKSFFHEEKRHLDPKVERLWQHGLGYRITSTDPEGRYQIHKKVICDPHLPCVLQHTRLESHISDPLSLYVLCAPHLEVGGWENNAYVVETAGREILVAEKNGTWLALGASVPFKHLSCGYVGESDGWQDLADNYQMDWGFDQAKDGNVAMTGELDLSQTQEFTVTVAFGDCLHRAITAMLQSLDIPFEQHQERYVEQWQRPSRKTLPLEKFSQDNGNLYYSSFDVLLAHEDKSYSGALIASLSIPWGEVEDGANPTGYHLVWVRDMINSATALLAAGNTETPLRALTFLAASQEADGGFPQNFWLSGKPFWTGVQLDQVAFPILLTWRLHRENALRNFDPYPMVVRAAGYLIRHGPATEQERWEEASGYSPSTLASNIAALICAACLMRQRGDEETAVFIEEYADFLECHIEDWTVTTEGEIVPDISRHYIRVRPADPNEPIPTEDPNTGDYYIINRPPEGPHKFQGKEIISPDFLELVRYGVRDAHNPIIVDSLKVVDAVLKTETPVGVGWHRYNYDGYGQRDDGSAFDGWGRGRIWALLTGERGHYELAAGNDPTPHIKAMEGFASKTGLLPEQSWDSEDIPEAYMFCGKPTGSAMPLAWAHGEYIKLLRSRQEGKVFDQIPEVAERYLGDRCHCQQLEIWKPNRQVQQMKRGYTLRIQAPAGFRLRWSQDHWQTQEETASIPTQLGIEYVDLDTDSKLEAGITFTFFWTEFDRWEGRDYEVRVKS